MFACACCYPWPLCDGGGKGCGGGAEVSGLELPGYSLIGLVEAAIWMHLVTTYVDVKMKQEKCLLNLHYY